MSPFRQFLVSITRFHPPARSSTPPARIFFALFIVLHLLAGSVHADPVPMSPRVLFLIGEDEYKTSQTLPEFAKMELEPRGMRVTVIQEDPKTKGNFPGLIEALPGTDLLILSTRRRLPPKAQLDAVRAYLLAGKPMVGIRTACHAFAKDPKAKVIPEGTDSWQEFDPQVLGGHYTGHHPPGPIVKIVMAEGAAGSTILAGVEVDQLVGNGSLYKVSPLDASCVVLLSGTIPGQPSEPVAWTHFYGSNKGRIFYTSLGHPEDFKETAFRKLFLNGILWAADSSSTTAPAAKTAGSVP